MSLSFLPPVQFGLGPSPIFSLTNLRRPVYMHCLPMGAFRRA